MEIQNQVRKFIVDHFYVPDASALSDEVSLLEQGIIDSTGVLEVIAFIEGSFQITVADDEMLPDNLDSISHIAAFVVRKRAAA